MPNENILINSQDLVVLGGGITGLATAYIAAKDGKKVCVLEAGKNVGGLLNTFEVEGERLEFFYHHFFMHDAELNWLIKDLGIDDKLFFKKTSMGNFKDGKIFNFDTPMDLLKYKPISFLDKIRFGFTSIYMGKIAKWEKFEGVSAMSWLNKWAGKSTADSLWNPLLTIKFGPYAPLVPLSWMIGRMRQRMGSRKGGDERLGYIEGSLQVLLDALTKRLTEMGVSIYTEAPVEKIEFNNNKITELQTAKGKVIAEKYISTIPSTYLSKMLAESVPTLSQKLQEVDYFGAICVVLEMKQKFSNIYWMNVADKGYPFGGIIEHTNFIPAEKYNNTHIMYLSRYFAQDENVASMSEQEIQDYMIPFLSKIKPEFSMDWVKKVSVFKTTTGATVCDLNFSQKIPNCKTEIDNFYIANMSHIYPDERSTNNSIRIAAEACRVMGINSNFVAANNSLSGKIGF